MRPPIPDPTVAPPKLSRRELWRRADAWALVVLRWAPLWIPALLIGAFVLRYFDIYQHIDVWIRAEINRAWIAWKMSTR